VSMQTTLSLLVRARQSAVSPFGGRGVAEYAYSNEFASGTGDNQADKCTKSTHAVAGSGSTTVDLRALIAADGSAANGAELVAIAVTIPDDASGVITLSDASSNGVGLFSGTTDGLELPAGSTFPLIFPLDGSKPMSGSAKDITFANAGGSSTTVTLVTLQRSA